MCSPKTPKAPPPAKKVDPRILLSRSQLEDFMIDPGRFSNAGGRGTGFNGQGAGTGSTGGGSTSAGLRIVR